MVLFVNQFHYQQLLVIPGTRENCENNERIYDHKLENLSSEMQTSHLFRGEEGGGRPETKNWPSHGREEQINSQREERLFTARLTSKLRCSRANLQEWKF